MTPGHSQIGDNEVGGTTLAKMPERFLRLTQLDDRISRMTQGISQCCTDQGLVFDNQDSVLRRILVGCYPAALLAGPTLVAHDDFN